MHNWILVLFNSYGFIFLYLPVVLAGFFWLAPRSQRLAALWLAAASLFFYGWWNPAFVGLLLASIVFNYGTGYLIGHLRGTCRSLPWLVGGIVCNLVLLGYFKYANFFIDQANAAGAGWTTLDLILPLGISFFTFTQIAFLVDVHRGIAKEYNFVHYLLFVTWFPHLIAGPVLHHKEMMPQFALPETYRPSAESIAVGLTLFTFGLFKKTVLADGVAEYATPVFAAAENGVAITFFEAWGGVLAYTLQIYFDFSGYSDMAIGLSRMFNVKLPLNFNSPYQAVNIIEFWLRWHMTLSRFLRDYLYIPLDGNRKGEARRLANLLLTMLLGGLWHGAGWAFVLWGGLHGAYLVLNHLWRRLWRRERASRLGAMFGWLLTMLAVIVAWVPFRAENLHGTMQIWGAMAGMNGFVLPESYLGYLNKLAGLGNLLAAQGWVFNHVEHFKGIKEISALACLILIAATFPNTQQILHRYRPAFETYRGEVERTRYQWMEWQPTGTWASLVAVLLVLAILVLTRVSEFLYFQF